MKHIETWEDFLKRTAKKSISSIDWQERKNDWISSIESLYTQIEKWLIADVKAGSIAMQKGKTSLREEYIGEYDAPTLTIVVGDSSVGLFPRGTLIIGSHGRIDMRGSSNQVMLIRDKANNWQFTYRDANKIQHEELTADTLKSWIQQVL